MIKESSDGLTIKGYVNSTCVIYLYYNGEKWLVGSSINLPINPVDAIKYTKIQTQVMKMVTRDR